MPLSLTETPSPREEYPEHDKLKAVKDQSQAIGSFLDWLMNERDPRVVLSVEAKPSRDNEHQLLDRLHPKIEELLAEYFEIDLDKLELEKVEMLAIQRALNDKHEEEAKQAKRKKKGVQAPHTPTV